MEVGRVSHRVESVLTGQGRVAGSVKKLASNKHRLTVRAQKCVSLVLVDRHTQPRANCEGGSVPAGLNFCDNLEMDSQQQHSSNEVGRTIIVVGFLVYKVFDMNRGRSNVEEGTPGVFSLGEKGRHRVSRRGEGLSRVLSDDGGEELSRVLIEDRGEGLSKC